MAHALNALPTSYSYADSMIASRAADAGKVIGHLYYYVYSEFMYQLRPLFSLFWSPYHLRLREFQMTITGDGPVFT
jgi:hypothetical protein